MTMRWGVLGASDFACRFMAPAIHSAEGAEFVALATSSPAKAEPFQAFCPSLRVIPSYDDLLADPNIDAVYIPLPNHLHIEWTLKALKAGKHVLTEKPIAMKADQIDALIAERDKTGLMAAEAFMIVQHPQFRRARELVQGGAIGRVEHVDVAFFYDNRTDTENIRNRPETGGGSLPDIGVYTFGSTRWVTGAEPVMDTIRSRIRFENDVDVYAQVTGQFDGPGGPFTYSSITSMRLFPRQEISYHGETGMIRLSAPYNANVFGESRLELHRPGLSVTTERWPDAKQYKLQVEAFGRSVTTGEPYAWPLEEAKKSQALIDRVFEVAERI
ncbi:MAG: oxidoreductase [Cereibacter sphaeroides]|uniref:Oxidoreductase n=1 Tax=Cereibacter sphaeroides TaxID=1063 RepID=A0A2W5S1J3_CERSP|nr:MAG: oxidoreductase [Cereibacter sphaeroides]